METSELKNQANDLYSEGQYMEAIELYSKILETEPNNHLILSNRSVSYLKLNMYDEAIQDAAKCTKLKPDWAKAWGRLGAGLYQKNKLNEALMSYNKAQELEPNEMYESMINEISARMRSFPVGLCPEKLKTKLNPNELPNLSEMLNNNPLLKNMVPNQNPQMGNLFNNMVETVISNPKIMEKIANPEFQDKMMKLQPLDALRDSDVMSLMGELMKNIKL
jgi:stress-induced-phosphoprotein 1